MVTVSDLKFGIAGGTEYTIYGLRETTSDLGIIVEYTFDDRNDFAFNNEGVLALRWTKNDIKSTSLLILYHFLSILMLRLLHY